MKINILALKLNNLRFRNKMLLLYSLCVLLPIVLTNLIFLNKITVSVEKQIYLVDNLNRVILSSNDTNKFVSFDEIKIAKDEFITSKNLDGVLSLKGWKIVWVMKKEKIFNALRESRDFVFFSALINILIATIVFNRMTTKMQELIHNEYESNIQKKNLELERKQAEINSLQSQINPHFLFNTLESIRMRSIVKGEHETAEIIKYLSKIFRRPLIWGMDLVTVKEEIGFIEDFLKIQKYRFGDKISYEILVSEEALSYKIPKMTIQPFVENASVHGIEGLRGSGKIILHIDVTDSQLQCVIEDNGIGISESKLSQILEEIKDEEYSQNIGIKNVYNRLKLFYGDNFEFRVESVENAGTKVFIKIPHK